MFKPQGRIKEDIAALGRQPQRIQNIIAIDEQPPIGEPGPGNPRPRDEKPHERRPINAGGTICLIGGRAQMEPVAPAAQQRPAQHLGAPERIARRPVHVANASVRVIGGGGPGLGPAAINAMKGGQRPGIGTRVIIHQHQPIRIIPLHRLAHALLEPARTPGVCRAVHHVQTRIRQPRQPRTGAIGAGIVDHHDARQIRRIRRKQTGQGHLQRIKPVIGHHKRHKTVAGQRGCVWGGHLRRSAHKFDLCQICIPF